MIKNSKVRIKEMVENTEIYKKSLATLIVVDQVYEEESLKMSRYKVD
jgi:hypothetical protein